MHKTLEVLDLEIDTETFSISKIYDVYAPAHLPIGVAMVDSVRPQRGSLNKWWLSRSIPASRSGLRDALERLNVSSTGLLLLKCMGLSLSDQYWVRSSEKMLKWEDINFFQNEFSGDVGNALFGYGADSDAINLISPDNTSDGWLQKKWAIADGKRVLIKGGSSPYYQEPLNEILATILMERLSIPHVPYTLAFDDEKPVSICEDFINPSTELVSAWSVYNTRKKSNNESSYTHYLRCAEELGIPGVRRQINQMLVVDFIIANEDRHFNNFGNVRNAETLEWLGAAPIYDSGTAMFYDKLPKDIYIVTSVKAKPFASTHDKQIRQTKALVGIKDWLDPQALDGLSEQWAPTLKASRFIEDHRYDALLLALDQRVNLLLKML
ncbi:MAG: hypothetical protein LBG97_08545 [Coriobacteriales bacterium]|jgi:hypothetical protein|nr:hypothetical protein [Coriobacteriales bacterium]